ncbi:hypothetical protein HPP92_014209 [Vanilla planifolia]|uniref:Uncharacterized protein n=1 Tax=Vanilla planifolia TaxID=51239 RepID=A0A835UXF1_VANPL|nr:hypothetical protein HPP92_014209 [Vanilla planifolia]
MSRNQQQQKQSLLSHKVGNSWSPRNTNATSPFAISPQNIQAVAVVSPLSYGHGSLAAQRDKFDQQMRNYPSTSMGTHVKQDRIENYEFACINATEEPDLSWVQSLVGKPEVAPCVNLGVGKSSSSTFHEEDEILGGLVKQMHLNHREAW